MPQAAPASYPPGAPDSRAVQLESTVSSVPFARHVVADDLRTAGIPDAVLDNVLVVVTELVSNAITHAKPLPLHGSQEGILLRWAVTDRHVLIDVTDGGGHDVPRLRHSPLTGPDGRGLAIVDALARDWSVRADEGSVTVQVIVGPWSGEATSQHSQ